MLKRSVILIWVSLLCLAAAAQTFNYPIEVVDGQEVYLYPVAKSEGLYRISKQFGVSQETIIAFNPELKSQGLKLGQIIKIPVIKAEKTQSIDSTAYFTHTLQLKETLYGISKKYGVTIDELIKLNPETAKKMAIGSTLLIPKKNAAAKKTFPKGNKTKVQLVEPIATTNVAQVLVSDTLSADTTKVRPSIRIAFLLPLMLDAPKREPSTDRFLEFYEGALLAINNLKNDSVNFEIYTYDIEKNDIKLQALLAQPEMRTMNAIIGPAYQDQVPCVAQFALENKIFTLVPFTSKIPNNQANPYLLPFNPMPEQEASLLAQYLQQQKDNVHCIFVETSAVNKTTESMHYLCDTLQANGVKCSQISIAAILSDSLIYTLQKKKRNILVCNTEKLQHIKTIFPSLTSVLNRFSVELLGHYGWLSQAAAIPVPMLYTSLFYTTAPESEIIAYSEQFEHYFGHELSTILPRYDMLGYDLTTYIISAISRLGADNLAAQLETYRHEGVQSSVRFTHEKATNKFINKNIFMLRYDDGQFSVACAPNKNINE